MLTLITLKRNGSYARPLSEGFKFYRDGELPQAIARFKELEQTSPSDPLCQIFIERCEAILRRGASG